MSTKTRIVVFDEDERELVNRVVLDLPAQVAGNYIDVAERDPSDRREIKTVCTTCPPHEICTVTCWVSNQSN
jgi:hypothetical protein